VSPHHLAALWQLPREGQRRADAGGAPSLKRQLRRLLLRHHAGVLLGGEPAGASGGGCEGGMGPGRGGEDAVWLTTCKSSVAVLLGWRGGVSIRQQQEESSSRGGWRAGGGPRMHEQLVTGLRPAPRTRSEAAPSPSSPPSESLPAASCTRGASRRSSEARRPPAPRRLERPAPLGLHHRCKETMEVRWSVARACVCVCVRGWVGGGWGGVGG
jgi:hypothetical protein